MNIINNQHETSGGAGAEAPSPTGDPARSPAPAGREGEGLVFPEIQPAPRGRRPRKSAAAKSGRYDASAYDVDAALDVYIGRAVEGRRLCPWHGDSEPSLTVDADGCHYRCWSCPAKGTAIDLVMHFEGLDFARAKEKLKTMGLGTPKARARGSRGSRSSGPAPSSAPSSGTARSARPSGSGQGYRNPAAWWDPDKLVDHAQWMLWRDDLPEDSASAGWLRYLRARRLTDETIREARLGLMWGHRWRNWKYRPCGILIPWLNEGGRVVRLMVRQPKGATHKYLEMHGGDQSIYPGPSAILPDCPLIICEGEFDRMLLDQELFGACGIITLGSAASEPTDDIIELARAASIVYAAHDWDHDPERPDHNPGEAAAQEWVERLKGAVRVRPPQGWKDWTDCVAKGRINLREFWGDRFAADGLL